MGSVCGVSVCVYYTTKICLSVVCEDVERLVFVCLSCDASEVCQFCVVCVCYLCIPTHRGRLCPGVRLYTCITCACTVYEVVYAVCFGVCMSVSCSLCPSPVCGASGVCLVCDGCKVSVVGGCVTGSV